MPCRPSGSNRSDSSTSGRTPTEMASVDPEILAHLEWLGFVQPTGLVVSAPALVRAGAILDRRDVAGQELLRDSLAPGAPEEEPAIADFEQFARDVFGWQ